VERALEALSAGRRPWLFLLLLCLGLFLPGIGELPPVDRDEARYLQASRQMLETGDFVRIRYQDEARNKKPVGVYWLQAAAMAATGRHDSAWPGRLVSTAGGTLAVLLTFGFGAAMFDRRTALVGAMLLAATADLAFEARVATTDAVLLPAAVAAQGVLGLAYLRSWRGEPLSRRLALAFWLAQGAALLIKGPVVPLLSLLTAASLALADRRARWLADLRPLWGVPLALAVVLPWLLLIERDTGGAFLREALGHDLLGKVAGSQEAHGAWPGYYLVLLPLTFWPATLFLGPAAIWLWHGRTLPPARLLAAWILPFWIVLELVPTKLPHYVLPLYPALALACARGVGRDAALLVPSRWLERGAATLWAAVGLTLGIGLMLLPIFLRQPPGVVGAAAASVTGAAVWQVLASGRSRIGPAALPHALAAALVLYTAGFGLVLPWLEPLWLSRAASRMVENARRLGEPVSATGYAEPSLVFLLGTDTRLLMAPQAAAALASHAVGLSLVDSADDETFRAALPGRGSELDRLGSATGFDYSNGKWLTLSLYRLRPAS
jgi:4-amino-4-deoxy-L-arabinose transferase-like glycosyltransferase